MLVALGDQTLQVSTLIPLQLLTSCDKLECVTILTGLGGRGGPYRLDKGHPVHQVCSIFYTLNLMLVHHAFATQVPEDMKKDVPPEVQERAREMAKDAFNKRLEEIKMSEGEMVCLILA